MTASVNLIGKTVESHGNAFNHVANTSDVLAYSLDRNAESIRIDIYDSSGKQVDLVKLGNQGQGKNTVSWNGNDSKGNPVPVGTYSFTVSAEDTSGMPIQVDTFSSGLVTDVVFGEDEIYAVVNGKELPISTIKRVSMNQ